MTQPLGEAARPPPQAQLRGRCLPASQGALQAPWQQLWQQCRGVRRWVQLQLELRLLWR